MDIKIGFSENQREIVIPAGEKRDELVAAVGEGLKNGGFFELEDSKGRRYFINAAEVAYVEVGAEARQAVGFGGI